MSRWHSTAFSEDQARLAGTGSASSPFVVSCFFTYKGTLTKGELTTQNSVSRHSSRGSQRGCLSWLTSTASSLRRPRARQPSNTKGDKEKNTEKASPPDGVRGGPSDGCPKGTNAMSQEKTKTDTVLIYCSRETTERIRKLTRGGETFDALLTRMAEQYNPDEAPEDDEETQR